MRHRVKLIGGPLCGATVPWETDSIDVGFKSALDSAYVWYRLSPTNQEALFWPMVDEANRRAHQRQI
jgi:hypothetical protein